MSLSLPVLLGIGLAIVIASLALIPRRLVRRRQDALAGERVARLEREGRRFRLLTRADLVAGRYRRIPGILGLTEDGLAFEGVFGESVMLASPRIRKVVTGSRLSNGRSLFRLEVLRITPAAGEEVEFVLTPASAGAWRSHLGLWAMAERQSVADRVVPGR